MHAAALLFVLASPNAQDFPSHAVTTLGDGEAPPTIDGRLEEPLWSRVTPLTGLRQVLPETGDPASERTEVRLCFGPQELYIAVSCFDSQPERSEEHTSELQSRRNLVCRLLLEKKNKIRQHTTQDIY